MSLPPDRIASLAEDLLSARDGGRQRPPLSDTEDGFGWDDAHAIAARIRTLRITSGETPVGRKIGFTNRTIWPLYGVNGPIWGDMFDRSVTQLDAAKATVDLPKVPEPRIEPEIVFGFGATPAAAMPDAELLDCIEWVAHGFEIVTSVYPGWKFAAADCQAAFGLHGALFIGPRQPLGSLGAQPAVSLAGLELTLKGRDVQAEGRGADVLDGPLQALRFLLDGLAAVPGETPLKAGDIVTTGTLTDAMPVTGGDRWQTEIHGCDLPGLDVTFR
ncbi:2-keto-4-pentenoate hydratase [Psychromarinibacter sp. S121]|uniref:2-keto-4-pentenoate hydratase n=1 Tax=Psychromarinibacter sp. S121 TaxID=3415127 RepID=UPI003C7E9BD4